MNELREWGMFWADWIIVVILVVEFLYDRWWNNREQRHKRRAKKHAVDFRDLNVGEGR